MLVFSFVVLVLQAADKVLLSLERKGKRSKRKAKEEIQGLFKGKRCKPSINGWKHTFVCLALCNQTRIPTKEVDKDDLMRAGLGEKVISFDEFDIGAEEFRQVLFDHFPTLKDGGGYEFFKCLPNSRLLEKLSSTCLSSPAILKQRVGCSKTYIRPIQQNLDLKPICELPGGVRY